MSSELQALNRQNRLAVWAERVSACRNSGLNARQWCEENDISLNTYYKWQGRVFKAAKSQQQFVQVAAAPSTGHAVAFQWTYTPESRSKHSTCCAACHGHAE